MSTNYPDTHYFIKEEWREEDGTARLEIIKQATEKENGKDTQDGNEDKYNTVNGAESAVKGWKTDTD